MNEGRSDGSLATQEPPGRGTNREAPWGALDRIAIWLERIVKEPVWGCRMCGQCILRSTGFTCPMTCPKNLRNGPCGGVRPNGNCEVEPQRACTWVKAWERARRLPVWGDHMAHVKPPVDWRLEGSSSWTNLLTGRDKSVPEGWEHTEGRAGLGTGGEAGQP